MNESTTLAKLPTELAGQICNYLTQRETSLLSLTNKSVYRLIRPILYYCPKIASFPSLTLFNRTLTQATYLGKFDIKWSTRESLNQTKYIDVTLDPTKETAKNRGQPAPAILIAKILQSIERRSPEIVITLRFEHCKCDTTPICNLAQEVFPRVRRLLICIGQHDPEETHPRKPSRCWPNANFFSPFVDGVVFPDCRDLEIRHHWAVAPHRNVDLFPHQRSGGSFGHDNERPSLPVLSQAQRGSFLNLDGLEKLQSIVLECVPELDETVMAQLLGNSKIAANLTSLELRFCKLADEAISQLLHHSPPNLKRLVILSRSRRDYLTDDEPAHLCPLFRKLGRKLVHLEFGAFRICRELFFDDDDRESIYKDHIGTCYGMRGITTNEEQLDTHAIRAAVQRSRGKRKVAERERRVAELLANHGQKSKNGVATKSLFGSPSDDESSAVSIRGKVERELDQEEEERKRSITGSRRPWFRRFMTWASLCEPSFTFQELQIAADLEESGITWVLAHRDLEIASQHSGGSLRKEVSLERAMEETYRIKE